jgi:hypothetical protein
MVSLESLQQRLLVENYELKASKECTIQVHVRRTGEVISIQVIPSLTTYGDIIKLICEKIKEPEPSHYYLALNYESEMQDDMLFEPGLENGRFQMIMRTKWLLEYIAERTMERKRLPVESKFHRNSSVL